MVTTSGTSPDPDEPCTTLQLPFAPASIPQARHRLSDELRARGRTDTIIADAELVISELLTNGLDHGTPADDQTLEVSWCVYDDRLNISVHDAGTVDTLRPIAFTDDGLRGRGLSIVDYLCDSWDVETDHGTRITVELVTA